MAKTKKTSTIKKVIKYTLLIALAIFAVFYILKDDPGKTFSLLSKAQFFPLFLAIVVLFITILIDSLSLTRITRLYNKTYKFRQGLINTMIGQTVGVFAKTAAPLLQVHIFPKQNVKGQQGASIMTMNFLIYQFSLFLFSLVVILIGYPSMKGVNLDIFSFKVSILLLCLIGLLIQFLFLAILILLAFCRPLHRFVLNSGVNILSKLRIIKEPEKIRRRWTITFATYRIEMKRLLHNKIMMVQVLALNLVKQVLLSIIPYIVLCSLIPGFAFKQGFFLKSLIGTGYTNVIASFLTVGAPEIVFQNIFSSFLSTLSIVTSPLATASACNIIWRALTFYLPLIAGFISFVSYKGIPKKYEILSNTNTIYDLNTLNLEEQDDDTKEYLKEIKRGGVKKNPELLTKEDLEKSFEEIRRLVKQSENDTVTVKSDEELLRMAMSDLAKVEQEASRMSLNIPSQDEIEKETNKDLLAVKMKSEKKMTRKEQRRERREAKEFLKMQPKGSKISIGEKGLDVISPEIVEIKTEVTRDEDEI